MERIKTAISLDETNPFITNFIYIKHSYLIFLFGLLLSIISVFLSRLLISNNNQSNWEEAIGQFSFDIIFRIGYSMIITCGWTLYNKKKLKCYQNLIISNTQIIDTIISFSYWGKNYAQHSTLRWDEQYLTEFDKILARIRYSLYGIMIISYYFYYYPNIKEIKNNWTIRKTISLFYMLFGIINLLITFGESMLSLYIFSLGILYFIILISYDIITKKRFENSHTHAGILLVSLLDISYYLPRLFLFLFNIMNNLYMKIFIFFVWEIIIMILDILMNKLINSSVKKNIKTLLLFPYYFSIKLYMDFIFLDKDFFNIQFFFIFFIKFILEIINDSGIIYFIQKKFLNKYIYKKEYDILENLKIIKNFTILSELQFFCERLSLFIILILILVDYIFDTLDIFIKNQKLEKHIKLNILLGYFFVFGMGLINNIITTFLRSKIYSYFKKKIEKNIPKDIELLNNDNNNQIEINNENIIINNEILNTKFVLSNWKVSYSFVFFLITYLIINGIDSSPLYK